MYINTTEIQRIITNHYEQLYANKLDSLEEVSKLPESYNRPRMNEEEKNLNRPIRRRMNQYQKSPTKEMYRIR